MSLEPADFKSSLRHMLDPGNSRASCGFASTSRVLQVVVDHAHVEDMTSKCFVQVGLPHIQQSAAVCCRELQVPNVDNKRVHTTSLSGVLKACIACTHLYSSSLDQQAIDCN